MTADHQGNNSLTSRIEMRQSQQWKKNNQLQQCILLYKKTLIQLTLSPDED